MAYCPIVLLVAKRLAGLIVASLLILVIAGKVLAIVATLSVFAAAGFMIWLPIHIALVGPHGVWKRSLRWRMWVENRRANVCARTLAGWQKVTQTAALVASVAVEIVGGAGAAFLATFAAMGPGPHLGVAVLIGGTAGAAVSFHHQS
jgi:hypothetical protein